MGNSCERCTTNSEVYHVSDSVLGRLESGMSGTGQTDFKAINACDMEFFERLKCIDDLHSKICGLTEEDVDRLFEQVQGIMPHSKESCNHRNVMTCYEVNPKCSLNCQSDSEHFIHCVDFMRIRALQRIIDRNKEKAGLLKIQQSLKEEK